MSWELFIPILIGLVSFIGKSIWDIYTENRNRKIELLEKQLSQFYYPLLIRLETDNVTWELAQAKTNSDTSLRQKVGTEIEKQIILPNHKEIREIIETHVHLCQDELIMNQLILYIKHISVYEAIRSSGNETHFPVSLEESHKWPIGLHPLLKEKSQQLQKKLDRLMWS